LFGYLLAGFLFGVGWALGVAAVRVAFIVYTFARMANATPQQPPAAAPLDQRAFWMDAAQA
jgi:hypothetical protein